MLKELTEKEIQSRHQDRFFNWISECAKLLGLQTKMEAAQLLDDQSWFWAFDDGLTPEEAVKEYKENK